MKLGKIFVYFILTCTFILPSCSSQIVSQNILNDEIAFQDILVGKTTYADLQKLDLIPLKDIDISTLDNLTTKPMCGHYIQYEGFDIFVDDTVETINIYDNYSGQLFANFYIGDSLQVVVNKLPQALNLIQVLPQW